MPIATMCEVKVRGETAKYISNDIGYNFRASESELEVCYDSLTSQFIANLQRFVVTLQLRESCGLDRPKD